jgi:hypothetical protein
MIDNSTSMGDKQEILASALPDLVTDLLQHVQDIHIGIVTSSLGGGGAVDICQPDARIQASEVPQLTNFNRHNDDRGHLINRKWPDLQNPPASGVEDPVAGALPQNFLAWMPSSGVSQSQLIADFQSLVTGAGQFGCGLEAQMESWYRFLVQPDPYDRIALDKNVTPPAAQLVGIDETILKQRHDFLRPDSLVAIVAVTDEEDSWSDPMWRGGRGWITRAQNNTHSLSGQLPRGTSACASNPSSPSCRWCADPAAAGDPNCASNGGLYGPKEDGLNVRYSDDMKRRYGISPQFPVERYVHGLTSDRVPDRKSEHTDENGKATDEYVGRDACTNPLFAASLPESSQDELCNMPAGTRPKQHVFFGLLGGVPWQLLTTDPQSSSAPFKTALDDADWKRIVGADPSNFDQTGIDPHMIESIKPRSIPCGTSSSDTCDPIHGREWDTSTSKVGIDWQYACTFPLPTPKDCTKTPYSASCDCGVPYTGPLCDKNPNDNNNLTLQVRGKAYPTIRELRVAKALGPRGIVGSVCVRTLDKNSPDYGYRPFVRNLLERIKPFLTK